jgi:hypothetical protein
MAPIERITRTFMGASGHVQRSGSSLVIRVNSGHGIENRSQHKPARYRAYPPPAPDVQAEGWAGRDRLSVDPFS